MSAVNRAFSSVVSELSSVRMRPAAMPKETKYCLTIAASLGPEPHDGAAVGTVWIALDAGERTHAAGYRWHVERDRVRRWAEQAGLDLVRRYLEGRELPAGDHVA